MEKPLGFRKKGRLTETQGRNESATGPFGAGGFWSVELISLADYVYWQWSPNYYSALTRKKNHLAPSERKDKIKAAGDALRTFVKRINENTDEDQDAILSALASGIFDSQCQWSDDNLIDLENSLRQASAVIKELSGQNIDASGRGRNNPGLHSLIGSVDMFWRSFSPDKKPISTYFEPDLDPNDESIDAKTIQFPIPKSTQFFCEIAQAVVTQPPDPGRSL